MNVNVAEGEECGRSFLPTMQAEVGEKRDLNSRFSRAVTAAMLVYGTMGNQRVKSSRILLRKTHGSQKRLDRGNYCF